MNTEEYNTLPVIVRVTFTISPEDADVAGFGPHTGERAQIARLLFMRWVYGTAEVRREMMGKLTREETGGKR